MLNVFKTFKLKWWQSDLFKISMASFGILLALKWPDFFSQYKVLWIFLFIVPAAYLTYVWWMQ